MGWDFEMFLFVDINIMKYGIHLRLKEDGPSFMLLGKLDLEIWEI